MSSQHRPIPEDPTRAGSDAPLTAGLPPVLTEEELCRLLRVEHDPDQVAYWVNRRGLPSIAFRSDGRTHRRFPTASVLAWLRSEAEKADASG